MDYLTIRYGNIQLLRNVKPSIANFNDEATMIQGYARNSN